MTEDNTPQVDTDETETETEGVEATTRNRIPLANFVEAWENNANGDNPSVQGVADVLGLTLASVQQRATKIRNPATKRYILDPETKKPVKVDGKNQYEEIPADQVAVKIPLTFMPKGGGAKYDGQAGLDLFNKLKAEREAAQKVCDEKAAAAEVAKE